MKNIKKQFGKKIENLKSIEKFMKIVARIIKFFDKFNSSRIFIKYRKEKKPNIA